MDKWLSITTISVALVNIYATVEHSPTQLLWGILLLVLVVALAARRLYANRIPGSP